MKINTCCKLIILLFCVCPVVTYGFQSSMANVTVNAVDSEGELLEGIKLASLMSIKNGSYDTIKRIVNPINSMVFENVDFGAYLVAIEHEDPFYWVPTYYGDVIHWGEAKTLHLSSDTTIQIQNFELEPAEFTGEGILNLILVEEFDGIRGKAKNRGCFLRRRMTGGRTVQDDGEFELFAYGKTDENGELKWQNLPEGVYRFFVEYLGIPLDPESEVQFEVGEQGISDTELSLVAVLTENGVEVDIERVLGVILAYFKDLKVYPNPVQDQLNVELPNGLPLDQIEMLDLTGKVVWKHRIPDLEANMTIQTSSFPKGTYVLRAKSSGRIYISNRIIIE